MNHAEKRQHPRTFFTEASGIIAHFEHKKGDGAPFPAYVMNMSASGIGVSTTERLSGTVSKGDELHLNFIKVKDSTSSVRGLPVKVQWVLEEPTNDNLVLGLEFFNVDPLMQSMVQGFIDSVSNK